MAQFGQGTRGLSPRVLVVTGALDPTADYVLRELGRREIPFWRTDLADFPQDSTVQAELRPDGVWRGRLHDQRHGVNLDEIGAVWWRKPLPFRFADGMSEAEERFALSQAKRAFAGLLGAKTDVVWVNRPERNADCTKPVQLTAAAEAGLAVPDTLITNDPAAVRPFAEKHHGHIITKVLGGIVHTEDGKRSQIYTSRVEPEQWDDPRIALTAHLFQREITDKAYEVRLTVVGDQLFPVAIHAPVGPGRLDWRRDSPHLSYTDVTLPSAVGSGVRQMMRRLGLTFAAVDFIVDSQGVHWLVDVNPGGRWAWIELTRSAITNALADLLEKGA
ncbi:hypothetical protein OG948_13480 [Embleya sp. NBC_00888]|uniref:MvdC/MvdD family ATP grasp protein n=1 Tax=Embleya sp. NBC_00888 TaxID=2975960 RepID=UPI00386F71D1|nr:hypothetical protein OG948_13480 [Embleya sp. NBC_00888]